MNYKKLFIIRTSMCRKDINYFEHFQNYGVHTTLKKAQESIKKTFELNKGWDMKQDEYDIRDNRYTYSLLSTDGVECYYRAIIDEILLNRNY